MSVRKSLSASLRLTSDVWFREKGQIQLYPSSALRILDHHLHASGIIPRLTSSNEYSHYLSSITAHGGGEDDQHPPMYEHDWFCVSQAITCLPMDHRLVALSLESEWSTFSHLWVESVGNASISLGNLITLDSHVLVTCKRIFVRKYPLLDTNNNNTTTITMSSTTTSTNAGKSAPFTQPERYRFEKECSMDETVSEILSMDTTGAYALPLLDSFGTFMPRSKPKIIHTTTTTNSNNNNNNNNGSSGSNSNTSSPKNGVSTDNNNNNNNPNGKKRNKNGSKISSNGNTTEMDSNNNNNNNNNDNIENGCLLQISVGPQHVNFAQHADHAFLMEIAVHAMMISNAAAAAAAASSSASTSASTFSNNNKNNNNNNNDNDNDTINSPTTTSNNNNVIDPSISIQYISSARLGHQLECYQHDDRIFIVRTLQQQNKQQQQESSSSGKHVLVAIAKGASLQ